jgi:hypothetical protein
MDEQLKKQVELLESQLAELKKTSQNRESRLSFLETMLIGQRVVIKNFEGILKIGTVAPTTNDTQEGSLLLTNESGTYKLYARINNGWRAVTLT